MKVLYISYCAPYDKAYNAGAQTLNYYIKHLSLLDEININVVTYCEYNEVENIISTDVAVKYHLVIRPIGLKRLVGRIISLNSKYNPFHKYCNLMTRYSIKLMIDELKKLSDEKYTPDIIFLEWTQIVLLIDEVKKLFPNSKIIASEPDVTFLSRERKFKNAKGTLIKLYKKIQYSNCKKREMLALNKADYIFTQCKKDVNLILDNHLENREKVCIQVPFYHKTLLSRNRLNNNILFFGAMSRKENSSAVEWFIQNVMPLIQDLPCKFVVLGGGVSESLKQLQTDKILMKGFVPSIDEDFANSMCFVCPLLVGAGIKVKVIEALYSNIPVLTNTIGIEGINAINGKNYIHCETANEYADAIRLIYSSPSFELCGRSVIDEEFFLDRSFDNYVEVIQKLI